MSKERVSDLVVGPWFCVAGLPFSAQEETPVTHSRSDGALISSGTKKVIYYRDSLGRLRMEKTMPGSIGTSEDAVFVEIVDPIGGFRYSFDSNSRMARRAPFAPAKSGSSRIVFSSPPPSTPDFIAIPTAEPRRTVVSPSSSSDNTQRPEEISEQIGTQIIEGVLAEGSRTTTVYPVGYVGNDRPVTTVVEIWYWRQMGMYVLAKSYDSRTGQTETTMKLTNISLAVPDASLFQPPAGYEIVDPASQPAQK